MLVTASVSAAMPQLQQQILVLKDYVTPGIFPYYVTGALTASGGSWNASIVAEAVTWGHTHLEAAGLGSFITTPLAGQ